jgi:hypothetical protein
MSASVRGVDGTGELKNRLRFCGDFACVMVLVMNGLAHQSGEAPARRHRAELRRDAKPTMLSGSPAAKPSRCRTASRTTLQGKGVLKFK